MYNNYISARHPLPTSSSSTELAQNTASGQQKVLKLEDCWTVLASGFLRGALGFFRNGTGSASSVNVEIRSGMTMVNSLLYVVVLSVVPLYVRMY